MLYPNYDRCSCINFKCKNTLVLLLCLLRFVIESIFITDFPPINITVQTKTDTGISITWSHAATCHERSKILITLVQSNGEVKEYPVHKDATSFDLTGLDPETTYSIMIYNMFGDIKSEASALVNATTGM